MVKTRKAKLLLFGSLLILLNLALFARFPSVMQNSESGNATSLHSNPTAPQPATSLNWIQDPTVSTQFIHPGMPIGAGGSTAYSFSVNHDANYSLDISAYYESIVHSGVFRPQAAYYDANRSCWLVVALEYPSGSEDTYPANIWLGIGNNATGLQWQQLPDQTNRTTGFAVAANNTAIRIVYLEQSQTAYQDSDRVLWVKYYASNNWGASWTSDILQNYFALSADWLPGISIAANSSTFECMWSFTNAAPTDFGTRNNLVTIWEARDAGNGWTAPQILPALNGFPSTCPQVLFDQSGGLYLCVNRYTWSFPYYQSYLYAMGNGPDGVFFTANWALSDSVYESNSAETFPFIYCAIDAMDSSFYFVNNTDSSAPDGVLHANSWGDVLGSWILDPVITGRRNSNTAAAYFNLFADQGPKLFASSVFSGTGGLMGGAGLLDCQAPFFFEHLSGTLGASEVMTDIFLGQDPSGSTHNASAYLFNLSVTTNTEQLPINRLVVGVNDTLPQLTVANNSGIISPLTSPGILDRFLATVNASSSGTISLSVDSLDTTSTGNANLTDEQNTCDEPAICGDGHNYYLFYEQISGLEKILFAQSSDGGVSWSIPRVIATFTSMLMHLQAACKGCDICCCGISQTSSEFIRFLSFDAGATFYVNTAPLTTAAQAITTDLICWRVDNDSTTFNISRSYDLGRTWTLFHSFPAQPAYLYNSLEAAAYDPVSGNYSFIVANDSLYDFKFITSNHNGTIASSVDGLGPTLRQGGLLSNAGVLKLGCRQGSDRATEWLILSNGYNDESSPLQPLGYRLKHGAGAFSAWGNFTDITGGETLPVATPNYASNDAWDAVFPDNGTPSVVTLRDLDQIGHSYVQVQVFYSTPFVFGTSAVLPAGNSITLSFNGVGSNGQLLADGTYSWVVSFKDSIGRVIAQTGNVTIDNTLPTLGTYASFYNSTLPVPKFPVQVTIPAADAHLNTGTLFYHTDASSTWSSIAMGMNPISATQVNFTAPIPGLLNTNTIYWYANISDTAGNTLLVNNGGQPFSYARGVFQTVKSEELLSPTLYDEWNWTYVFTSGIQHVSAVWVRETPNNASSSAVDIPVIATGPGGATFTVHIAHDLIHENVTYTLMYQSDEGDNYTIASKLAVRPSIRLEEGVPPAPKIDLTNTSSIAVEFQVPEHPEYISYVFITYTLDKGASWHVANMTGVGGNYNYTFTNFPKTATQLNYTVTAVDIYDQKISFSTQAQSITLLPALPLWDMSGAIEVVAIVAALAVGVVCGGIYTKLVRGKPTLRELTLAEQAQRNLVVGERAEKSSQFFATRAAAAMSLK